jgi:hypothetical protein
MIKKHTSIPQKTYDEITYEKALANKEKRKAIVNSDEPYICPKCGIPQHPKEFGTQYMKNDLV